MGRAFHNFSARRLGYLYGTRRNIHDDIMKGVLGANEFICGEGVDTVLDYNPAKGDTISNDCEIVNTIS